MIYLRKEVVSDAADGAHGTKRILLAHYPDTVDRIKNQIFNLVLAGHSHGGQIRLPFIGALIVPYGVGDYDLGLFHTPAGPLYVNPGLGTLRPVRFLCRPEITVITDLMGGTDETPILGSQPDII